MPGHRLLEARELRAGLALAGALGFCARARGRDGDLVMLQPSARLRARIEGMGLAAALRMADKLPG